MEAYPKPSIMRYITIWPLVIIKLNGIKASELDEGRHDTGPVHILSLRLVELMITCCPQCDLCGVFLPCQAHSTAAMHRCTLIY